MDDYYLDLFLEISKREKIQHEFGGNARFLNPEKTENGFVWTIPIKKDSDVK